MFKPSVVLCSVSNLTHSKPPLCSVGYKLIKNDHGPLGHAKESRSYGLFSEVLFLFTRPHALGGVEMEAEVVSKCSVSVYKSAFLFDYVKLGWTGFLRTRPFLFSILMKSRSGEKKEMYKKSIKRKVCMCMFK